MKDILGTKQKEAWSKLARNIGAEFEEGGLLKSMKVLLPVDNWDIVLDNYVVSNGKYSTTYTRMRVVYESKESFSFKLYKRGLKSKVKKLFGSDSITSGNFRFDEKVAIYSKQPDRMKEFLNNDDIRRLILMEPKIYLEIKQTDGSFGVRLPKGVSEIYYTIEKELYDIPILELLFELFRCCIYELEHLEVASKQTPRVKL